MGEKISASTAQIENVVLSQGLWTNIPDLDAVRVLMDGDLNGQSKTRLSVSDYGENFVVAENNYLTVCSMNVAFKREIIPAFYQFKMDDNPWKIGRFDDIWSGVVLKHIADSMGYSIMCGKPFCRHDKAPRSTFKDLRYEAPGLEANERFFQVVDSALARGNDIFADTEAVALSLSKDSEKFISFSGKYLLRWLQLLQKVSPKL